MERSVQESIMLAAIEGDLPSLLAIGRDCLGRPLLLGGETLNVLGWSGPPTMPEDAVWENYIEANFAPTFHWSDSLYEANSLDLSHGFTVCQIDRPDGITHWVTDIEMPNSQPLHLILADVDGPLPPPDPELMGLICLSIRACINSRASVEPYQRFSSEQLLLQLIRTERIDEPILRYRAESAGMESEGYFSLLMLDLQGYHPQRNSVATIRSQLSAVLGPFSVIDGEVLTFLVNHTTENEAEKQSLWAEVEPILSSNKLFGLISSPFFRLGEFHYHYVRTCKTLKLRFCVRPDRYLVPSTDLSIYSLIAGLKEMDSVPIPPHPILRALLISDQARKTFYTETLSAYLSCAQKPVPTCEALHIHRNTLDYRLRRIEELTGLDWSDGDLLFRLYLSLCALRYERLVGNQTSPLQQPDP